MNDTYLGLSPHCDLEVARPGDEAGCVLLCDGDFALVLSDDSDKVVVVIEGTPAELRALIRRAQQALEEHVGTVGEGAQPADR